MEVFDNGLIKSLERMKKLKFSDGFLDLHSFPIKNLGEYGLDGGVKKVEFNGDTYFKKHFRVYKRYYADAEILSSQIFCNMGIRSATYLPVYDKDDLCVYSDDLGIDNDSKYIILDYCQKLAKNTLGGENVDDGQSYRMVNEMTHLFNSSSNRFAEGLTYFAKRQLIKARILQVVVMNSDNSTRNMAYVIGKDGKIADINVLDHEAGGLSMSYKNTYFFNDFSDVMSGKTLIRTIKTSPVVAQFLSQKALHDFAESLGSLDIDEFARDFKGNFGYEIDRNYVDLVMRSRDEVAEDLLST